MTRERYRFAKQVNGRAAYADVEIRVVSVGPASRQVTAGDNVFAWLKEDYGPDAWEWPVCDEYRKAAVDGVNFALDNSTPAVEASVLIECIRAAPADSSAETIAYAAAQATGVHSMRARPGPSRSTESSYRPEPAQATARSAVSFSSGSRRSGGVAVRDVAFSKRVGLRITEMVKSSWSTECAKNSLQRPASVGANERGVRAA